jgi:hypothetical protein
MTTTLAAAPSWFTFGGALVTLLGTLVVLVGYLPSTRKRGWEDEATRVGTCAIGIGAAASFLPVATDLTSGELDFLYGGLALATLGLLVALLGRRIPRPRRKR